MKVYWCWPSEIDGVGNWLCSFWSFAEPITQRRYQIEHGHRLFGLTIIHYHERAGSVL